VSAAAEVEPEKAKIMKGRRPSSVASNLLKVAVDKEGAAGAEAAEKTFEGGFFSVRSPLTKITPKNTPKRTPAASGKHSRGARVSSISSISSRGDGLN
jgi:hypothetical protein